jgi:hypothetical protein
VAEWRLIWFDQSRKTFKTMRALLLSLSLAATVLSTTGGTISLFDGKTFIGWEGDTNKTWRISDGTIMGGKLTEKVPHNEFICTTRSFTNFVLRVKFKLVGTVGFVNGGVQVRSKRVPNHFEVEGYQADMGDGWWGCLYDESRRNKVLVKPDPAVIEKTIKRQEWNDYEIRCEGPKITVRLNGVKTVEWNEDDPSVAKSGVIGLQIHGGGQTEVFYKDLTVDVLP